MCCGRRLSFLLHLLAVCSGLALENGARGKRTELTFQSLIFTRVLSVLCLSPSDAEADAPVTLEKKRVHFFHGRYAPVVFFVCDGRRICVRDDELGDRTAPCLRAVLTRNALVVMTDILPSSVCSGRSSGFYFVTPYLGIFENLGGCNE